MKDFKDIGSLVLGSATGKQTPNLRRDIPLHLETPLSQTFRDLFAELQENVQPPIVINGLVFGGAASHIYANRRLTTSIDVMFEKRVGVSTRMVLDRDVGHGYPEPIYIWHGMNRDIFLQHENVLQDSFPLPLGSGNFVLQIMHPVDIALSRINRMNRTDISDIRDFLELELFTEEDLLKRLEETLAFMGARNPKTGWHYNKLAEVIHVPEESLDKTLSSKNTSVQRP